MTTLLLVLGVGALSLTASPALADGDVDDFSFRSMHVDYELGRDEAGESTLQVVETLVAEFPEIDQNRGIRRMIPDQYQDASTRVEVHSVTDEQGNAREWEEDTDDGYVSVTAAGDDYVHGEQTYVITYEMTGVTRAFADTGVDEFYWDVNGTGWSQPFGDVSMTLHIDPEISSALTGAMSCYVGVYGSNETCAIKRSGDDISASSGAVEIGGNMTVAVAFEPGTFTPRDTSFFAGASGWGVIGGGLVGIVGIVAAVFSRRKFMQDEDGHPTVVAQYEPPAGYDAFASAVLLEKANGPTAELLEQAVRGSIRLVEVPQKLGKPKLRAELVDAARAGDHDGHDLLVGLFGAALPAGAAYDFDGHDATFASHVEGMVTQMKKAIADAGVRRAVPAAARVWPVIVSLVAAVVVIIAMIGFDSHSTALKISAGALVAVGCGFIAVLVIVSKRPFTRAGAQVRDHLRGLEMFMRWAEADRIRMLQSRTGAERVALGAGDPRQMIRLYEPLLPYAVVFGLEKEWSGLVTGYYDQIGYAPIWYSGPHGFSSGSLAAAVASTSTAMSTASSSSSSGGSSGGGSSGGGGGGGGGGGV